MDLAGISSQLALATATGFPTQGKHDGLAEHIAEVMP